MSHIASAETGRPMPELVFERPSRRNGFQWTWVLCQPDATWAELAAGGSRERVKAVEDGRRALNRTLIARGEPAFVFDPIS